MAPGTSGSHWPSVAVFHNSRLWLGATEAEPQRLWASEVDDFDSFAPSESDFDVLDENAIDVKINDNRANALRWLVSDRVGLLCLTSGGEFVMAGPNDAALTPGNTTIRRHSSRGANALARPVQAGVSTLFFQTDRKLRSWPTNCRRTASTDLTSPFSPSTSPSPESKRPHTSKRPSRNCGFFSGTGRSRRSPWSVTSRSSVGRGASSPGPPRSRAWPLSATTAWMRCG